MKNIFAIQVAAVSPGDQQSRTIIFVKKMGDEYLLNLTRQEAHDHTLGSPLGVLQ